MRINKYIASCGVCSRRKADLLIEDGQISINGQVINEFGIDVDPDKDVVLYQGVVISINNEFEYYMLNKPTEVVCTCEDTHGRKTVLDIVKSKSRLYPVGRLDADSSGLIILTNDGDVTNRITHPSFELDKEYLAVVKGKISDADIEKLKTGIYIDGKITSKAQVERVKVQKYTTTLKMIIHEGRNRQIRKMIKGIGSHVYELKRIRLGNLNLDGLQTGQYRALTEKEVDYLKKISR